MSIISGSFTNSRPRNPPNVVVQDGLELLLDAGVADSYPGTGTTWFDISGNQRDFTISGSPAHTSGNDGFFVTEDADSIQRTGDSSIGPGTGDFTISAWFLKTEIVENAYMWDFGSNGGTLSAGTSINNSWRYYNISTGISSPLYTSNGAPTADDWYNITVTRDSGTTRFYVNNVETSSDTGDTHDITSATSVNVARYGANTTLNHIGRYAAFMVYHRVLTAAERAHNHKVFTSRYLSTVVWPNVDTWSLDTAAISYPSSAPGAMDPVNMTWNDDGTRLYIWGDTGANSGPWYGDDALTTPYVPQTQTGATQVANYGSLRVRGGVWNADGTALIIPLYGNGTIRKYANSGTAYNPNSGGDLTTTHSETFTFTPSQPRSIDIHPDGTKMWVISNTTGRDIYEVNMSTPYDLTTASMGNEYEPAQADMLSMRFSPDGYKYYALALTTGVIHEYTVSTQWDISTSSYTSRSLNVKNSRSPIDFIISPDGTKMIILYFSTSVSEVGYYTI